MCSQASVKYFFFATHTAQRWRCECMQRDWVVMQALSISISSVRTPCEPLTTVLSILVLFAKHSLKWPPPTKWWRNGKRRRLAVHLSILLCRPSCVSFAESLNNLLVVLPVSGNLTTNRSNSNSAPCSRPYDSKHQRRKNSLWLNQACVCEFCTRCELQWKVARSSSSFRLKKSYGNISSS